MNAQNGSYPTPLYYGRLARILAGVISIGIVGFLGQEELGSWGFWGLLCLGASFLVAGIFAMPGCEITAIPNLFLPKNTQIHCFCPVFSPLDKFEYRQQPPSEGVREPK